MIQRKETVERRYQIWALRGFGKDKGEPFELFKKVEKQEDEIESLRQQLTTAQEELKEARDIIARVYSGDDECHLDHHGYCQEHLLELDCSVKRARSFLAKYPREDNQRPGCAINK